MNIILTAFGDRLRGQIEDWPEPLPRSIHMPMFEGPPFSLAGSSDPLTKVPVRNVEFQRTGRTWGAYDGRQVHVYELVLPD